MAEHSPTLADLSPEQRALLALRFKNRRSAAAAQQRIPRRAGDTQHPLSFEQEQLWFLHQIGIESGVHHLNHFLLLRGALDVAALGRSLDEIVRRHEILRTRFVLRDDAPVQVVAPFEPGLLSFVDLSDAPAGERDERARSLAAEQGRRRFDLAQGPMLRATLARLRADEHLLLLTFHHIVTDWVSFSILARELSLLYSAHAQGQQATLPELPIQFGDFAAWQRERLQGESLERLLSYWTRQLAGVPPLLRLPTDRPRPAVQTYRGHRHYFALPRELFAAFQELARREKVTAFTALLGVFQTLLHRYTRQEDVPVSTPVAMRHRAETEGLIGFLLNTLLLRADFAGGPSFLELLARLRPVIEGAYAHQELPFPRLVQELRPERDLSYTPFLQANFIYLTAQAPAPEALGGGRGGLELRGLEVRRAADEQHVTSEFDLTLVLEEKPEGLSGIFWYNTDLFDLPTVERMTGHLRRLMESILAEPHRPVASLPLLTDAELRQLTVEPNRTARDYPSRVCVQQLFEAQAARTPDALALTSGDEKLSYAELNARANRLARYLRRLGVGPEATVGVMTERGAEMIVALLGVLKAGGSYLPLDAAYPPARLAWVLRDAGVRVLLTQRSVSKELSADGVTLVRLEDVREELAAESASNVGAAVLPENAAYLIYTSGSTGTPKGVQVAHAQLSNFIHAMRERLGLRGGDVVPALTALTFDIAGLEIFLPLVSGAAVVVVGSGTAADGGALSELLRQSGVTLMQATPSGWRLLLDAGWKSSGEFTALCGGEALSQELAASLLERGATLHNLYGPTETTIWSTHQRVETAEAPVLIGRPIANTTAYVLDPHLRPVPAGVNGELYLGGRGLARGYVNRPALTAEKFVPDPFSREPGARLYRTGDLARQRATGELEFVGRADAQVKIRGYRIEPGEIEAALEAEPCVRAAAVVARAGEARDGEARDGEAHDGEAGATRLVAYVAAAASERPNVSELRARLRERLPAYMIPAAFVFLDELPLTPNGKVDRRALPAPGGARPELAARYLAPRNEAERAVTDAWCRALQVEQVGVNDNFFDLGGHSLLLVKIHAELRAAFARDLPLVVLFQHPTVSAIAEYLSRPEGADFSLQRSEERAQMRSRSLLRRGRRVQHARRPPDEEQ